MNERMNWTRILLWILLYLALGSFVVGITVIAVETYSTAASIRATQNSNTSTLNFAKESLRVLKDCTEQTGKCYQEGQKAQGKAIGSISLSQVAAVACADAPGQQTVPEIQACVKRTMAQFGVPVQ
jgi:hypothetical protein